MFDTVLIGYDGGEPAQDALALARVLARPATGRLIAVCVPGFGSHRWLTERVDDDVQLRTLRGHSPAHVLQELADSEHPSLIVVGSTHRGKFGRTFPGSTADQVVHRAPCPVAIAPAGYRVIAPESLSRIGAAVCVDALAVDALRIAAAVAEESGATLEAIAAFEGSPIARVRYGELGAGEVVVDVRGSALTDLYDLVAELDRDVPVTPRLLDGSPASVLVEQSARLDLLVMGSRGHGPLGRVLLGSVSHAVMLECPAPVLVVPRGSKRGKAFASVATLAPMDGGHAGPD
jgi:nucleotide-binding universal stress UspA family protein